MGTIVVFPEVRSTVRDSVDAGAGSATVIILPVVRIERYDEAPPSEPESSMASGRNRRRRDP